MKLLSFTADGQVRCGRLTGDQVEELVSSIGGLRPYLLGGPESVKAASTGRSWPLHAITYAPPIPDPGKILCVGLNYHDHLAETGRPPSGYPTIFTRFADTQVGHDQPILLPDVSSNLDYEGELAVIIGRPASCIPESDAFDHVAAYACYNDVSVRDWQRHGQQWTPGKNFPGTGPFGPWLVTADEIGDRQELAIATRVNGETLQAASTRQLIFSIPRLISYISSFTPLGTGDVICTGTPGGVGFTRKPPIFLKAGDVVEVEIEAVGVLRNTVMPADGRREPSHA